MVPFCTARETDEKKVGGNQSKCINQIESVFKIEDRMPREALRNGGELKGTEDSHPPELR